MAFVVPSQTQPLLVYRTVAIGQPQPLMAAPVALVSGQGALAAQFAGGSVRMPVLVAAAPATAGIVGMPVAPASLTEGMISPADVAKQKEEYKKGIDEQLRQGEAILNEQTLQRTEYIRMQAQQEKALALGRWDQNLRAQEMAAEQEYQLELARLQDLVRRQKAELEKQASQMIMEYNTRKTQQEINQRVYDIQLQHWHAESQMANLTFEDRLRFQAQLAAHQQHLERRVVDNLPEVPLDLWVPGDRPSSVGAFGSRPSTSPYPLASGL